MSKLYEYCPNCQNDVDDLTHNGICEECEFKKNSTPEQRKKRAEQTLIDMIESGRPLDSSDY